MISSIPSIRKKDKKTGKAIVTQQPLSTKSIRNIHGIFTKALNTAVDVGLIKTNPAERVIKTVQGNLGHATAAFALDKYGHVSERMKEDSAARMEKYMQAMNKPTEMAN